jgi:hypothetical protein
MKAPAREVLHLVLLPSGGEEGSATLLATWGGARVVEPFATKGGEAGERMRKIIAAHEHILGALDGTSGREPPRGRELLKYGALLFETLFPGEVRRLYDAARAGSGRRRLDLVFTSAVDWIADKPWEFAYDPSRHAFLAAEDVNFLRGVLTPVPAAVPTVRRLPLRILVASARPAGAAAVSAAEEEAGIRRSFSGLVRARLATVDVLKAASPDLLHRRLAAKPYDVLHFVGHGTYDEEARTGFLVFEGKGGEARPVDARTFRQVLAGRGLSLVFLNACETGRGGRADFNRGVAPSLAAGGVPAVVANQYRVLDEAATAFARHFYRALAQGKDLAEAARDARVAVSCAAPGPSIDWAVPVVYARDPGDILCRPPAQRKRSGQNPVRMKPR